MYCNKTYLILDRLRLEFVSRRKIIHHFESVLVLITSVLENVGLCFHFMGSVCACTLCGFNLYIRMCVCENGECVCFLQ